MKLSKLMLSAAVAALALVSCNKQGTTPEPSKTLKSVEINIENLVTKGAAESAITEGTAVKLNNLKIYLVDANGTFLKGKTADGTADAQDYFSTAEDVTAATSGTVSFHYVDRAVTHVIAVGNMGETTFDNEAALNAYMLNIDAQQLQGDLKLYSKEQLTGPDGTHGNDSWTEDGKTATQENQVYKADLTLMPRIARFEVDGFRVKFTEDNPETPEVETPIYNNITITQLAFTNYQPQTTLYALAPSGDVVNAVADYTNETAVYQWFVDHLNGGTAAAPAWSYYVDATPLSFDAPAAGGEVAKDFTVKQAFHFFPGTQVPTFLVHLTADGVPAFLYTKKINLEGEAMEAADFKAGYVYRMSAASEEGEDGSILVDEKVIDPMDRCLDITVSVEKWVVELVTPEF